MGTKKDYEDILLGVAEALNELTGGYGPEPYLVSQTYLKVPDRIDVVAIRRRRVSLS